MSPVMCVCPLLKHRLLPVGGAAPEAIAKSLPVSVKGPEGASGPVASATPPPSELPPSLPLPEPLPEAPPDPLLLAELEPLLDALEPLLLPAPPELPLELPVPPLPLAPAPLEPPPLPPLLLVPAVPSPVESPLPQCVIEVASTKGSHLAQVRRFMRCARPQQQTHRTIRSQDPRS
jgi:hypothetical protein